jgi:hypothetical protein
VPQRQLLRPFVLSWRFGKPTKQSKRLADYAATWIIERPGLRPRTVDLYRWLLKKHIRPHLGGTAIGRLSTAMIREWRAKLLASGVSVSVAAKAYRLLRAVLTTAVEEDKILARNPCRIRGAGDEDAPERPVLTVAQVFQLAELVGRGPVGNIRKLPAGGYRLRFRRHGQVRTSPEVHPTRTEAERALWTMADDGRADCDHDRAMWRSSCWPPSPSCAGVKQPHYGAATSTWRRAPCESGPRSWSGQLGKPARPAQVPSRAARGRHPPGDHPATA